MVRMRRLKKKTKGKGDGDSNAEERFELTRDDTVKNGAQQKEPIAARVTRSQTAAQKSQVPEESSTDSGNRSPKKNAGIVENSYLVAL